ncbi:MAG: triose-phosphate isomerase [Candidatus Diapherotrites archaeon]|nr:triose-phosphate isomerase [Candidatus Diapherotrites archaeon]
MTHERFLFVNFKAYLEASHTRALDLVKAMEDVQETHEKITLIPVVQALDLAWLQDKTSLPLWGQHADSIQPGAFTGHVLPEALKIAGATGTLVNHAERKVDNAVLERTMARCREATLLIQACAETVERAIQIASMPVQPNFIAFEPPELIGGTVSVSSAQPEIVQRFVEKVRERSPNTIPICGAGVKNAQDVAKALELGTQGILVASGVVKAPNQKEALEELCKGFGQR